MTDTTMPTSPAATAKESMVELDVSANPRIPILMDMVGSLSRAKSPNEVLKEFSAGVRKLEGPRGYVSLSTRNLAPGEYRITRLLVEEDFDDIDHGNPWRDGGTLPVHTGGLFGDIIAREEPRIFHHLRVLGDPVVGDALAEYGSMLAIPLFDDGRALNWAIMLKREPDGYTERDLEEAILRGNLVGTSVRNVLAAQQLRAANARVQREVEQIARIQRSLLPPELPNIPGVSLGVSFETFDRAGGDLYDVVPLRFPDGCRGKPDPNGPWGLHIADAAGHGPAAATIVAMLNAILRASPESLQEPGELLTFANEHLCRKRLEGTFVTAVLALYDPPSRRFTYARAGHNPLLHMERADDGLVTRRLDGVGGIPLGVASGVQYTQETIQLRPAQTVVFYTDGITEAMDPDGAMFEVSGIERSLTECSGEPDCVIGHVTEALREHEGGRRPADDQTILVLRVD